MLLPVPFFWTLYDQQPTVWMVQALQMDCRLWGGLSMLPDQMQTLNTVFILVYIPIFQVGNVEWKRREVWVLSVYEIRRLAGWKIAVEFPKYCFLV
jgi:dipeptide/tripeptide permease